MSDVRYAKISTLLVNDAGDRIAIVANDTWDANDPLVRQHPEFFTDEPLWLRHTVPTEDERAAQREALGLPRVEQATRAPGEQRKR